MMNISKKFWGAFLFIALTQLALAIDPGSAEPRNIIGVEMVPASPEQIALAGCKQEGVYVNAVIPNHPADIAGLKVGDIILKINSERVTTVEEALRAMDYLEGGRKYPFRVCRKTQDGTVMVDVLVLVEKVQERAIGKIS